MQAGAVASPPAVTGTRLKPSQKFQELALFILVMLFKGMTHCMALFTLVILFEDTIYGIGGVYCMKVMWA